MKKNIFCYICNKETTYWRWSNFVHSHLEKEHHELKDISEKEYFDRYKRKENEGKCSTCGGEAKFESIRVGYKKFCGNTCANKFVANTSNEKRLQTKLERYGSTNYVNTEKQRQTKLDRHGFEWFPEDLPKLTQEQLKQKHEKSKQTKLERYGDANYCNAEQISKTKKEANKHI
jgi:hypothetical protein